MNAIASLHGNMGHLTGLRVLDLESNELKAITPLVNCVSLVNLNASANHIRYLPDGVERWTALQRLRVNDNQLRDLPGTIGACTTLQKLFLENNLFEDIPANVSRTAQALFDFVKQRNANNTSN